MACGACNHKDPVSVFFRRVPMRLATQNASTSPTQTAIEGRCFPCVPVRSAYPKDLNLINETISGDHAQHVFLYKKDLNITQQLSLENMLNQTPLAHGVATTLPDAFRVRITRKTCCQNQTQRLSQVRVGHHDHLGVPQRRHSGAKRHSWLLHFPCKGPFQQDSASKPRCPLP